MGIDIPSVAAVILMSPPRTIEEFAQMAGRAGRALGNGVVLLMCSDEDKQCLNAWAYTDYIHPDVVMRLLKWVRRSDKKRFGCMTDALAKELDIKPESVHTILQLMNLDEELPLTLMGRHPLHVDVKRYLMRPSTASHPVVDKALDMTQAAKGSKGVRLADLCNALAMDPDCVISVLRVAEAGKMITVRSVDTAMYYQVTCTWSEAVQKHCCDNLVATMRLLQQRVVMRTAAMLDLVDEYAKTSWTQALVRSMRASAVAWPYLTRVCRRMLRKMGTYASAFAIILSRIICREQSLRFLMSQLAARERFGPMSFHSPERIMKISTGSYACELVFALSRRHIFL
jgi:hypothetical protein